MSQIKSKSKRKRVAAPDSTTEPEMERPKGRKRRALDEGILAKAQKYMTSIPEQQLDPKFNEEVNFELPKRKKARKGKQKKSEDPVHPAAGSKKARRSMVEDEDEDEETKSPAKKSKKNKKKKKKTKAQSTPATALDKNPDKEKRHIYECLEFLRKWESNRSEWKFEKLKQVWLLKNILNSTQINDEDFQILLSYMGSVQGHARGVTLKEMAIFMEAYETKYLGTDKTQKPAEELTRQYNRAREIVQMLSDEEGAD